MNKEAITKVFAVVGVVLTIGMVGWGVASAGIGQGVGTPSEAQQTPTPQEVSDPPTEVAQNEALAGDLLRNLTQYYPDPSVWITRDGRLVADIATETDSGDGVIPELRRVSLLYANIVSENGHNATTLSVVTGEVEAVATQSVVDRYSSGNLTDEAFKETVEVRSIDRRNTTAAGG